MRLCAVRGEVRLQGQQAPFKRPDAHTVLLPCPSAAGTSTMHHKIHGLAVSSCVGPAASPPPSPPTLLNGQPREEPASRREASHWKPPATQSVRECKACAL